MITCALAWSGEVWGQPAGYNEVTTSSIESNHSIDENTKGNLKSGTYSVSFSNTISEENVIGGTSANVTFSIGGNMEWYGAYNCAYLYNNKSAYLKWSVPDYYTINLSSFTAEMRATVTGYVKLTPSSGTPYTSGDIYRAGTNHVDVPITNLSLDNSGNIKIETVRNKAGLIYVATYFNFYHLKFTYTLSHYELDLSALESEINKAQKKYNALSNIGTIHADTLNSAISDANTFYNSDACKFPNSTYWNNASLGTTPAEVSAEVLKLQKAQAIYDYEEAKFIANNKGYTNTNIRTATYNSIQTYLNTTYTTTGTATVATINTKTSELLALINTADTERTAISNFNTAKSNAANYSTDVVPNAVYTQLHYYDSHNPLTASVADTNSATTAINTAISAANATTAPYLSAVSTLNTFENEYPSKTTDTATAADDLVAARSALEASTTTEAIANALKKVKNFDSITFNGATSIAMGGSITNPASAESTRSISYSVTNSPTIMTVSGTTLNAVAPGQVTVTATTGSTGNGYYKCEKTQVYDILPVFYFSVAAQVGTGGGGSVSLEGNQSSVTGAAWNTPSASLNLKFTATPDDGYVFLGWGTTAGATSYESEGETYELQLTNDAYGQANEMSKTLYAIFEPKSLTLNPGTTPGNSIEGLYKGAVTLSRTLKAGYSTIALPFDTDVEELVDGRAKAYDSDVDWVAQLSVVTNSEADGYTLYFQKVTGGTITANQPYILHLGTEVVNPTWTNANGITVAAASAASISPSTGYSGYSGWSMHANYEAGFPMAGKYGIVNSAGLSSEERALYPDGYLKQGGSGSSLNAFTAYIAGPQANSAPRLRVAYVDEDGTATFIGTMTEDGLEGEPVAIYGPDGQRRSKMQPGVNIVRYSDGTSRKVRF